MKRFAACLLISSACAAVPRVPSTPVDPSVCPSSVDGAALLRRHASAYGTEAAVRAALPRAFHYRLETEGKVGTAELTLDVHGHRYDSHVAGVQEAAGVDEHGPWSIGVTGVLLQQTAAETPDVLIDGWIARREYIGAYDAKRDPVGCRLEAGHGPRIAIRYARPELGNPQLEFDARTAALILVSTTAASGRETWARYDGWTPSDDDGVRWPAAVSDVDELGNNDVLSLTASEPARCQGDCLAPPKQRMEIDWPEGGAVHVPMRHYLGELSLRVSLAGKETWALLDSGAGATVVDSTTPASRGFVSNLELAGVGATQALQLGLGELADLRVGTLALKHVAAASIPIPALDAFGDRRPEVVLGFSLFEAAVVRVDYAKSEVVFARSTTGLVAPSAQALPIIVLDGKPLAKMLLDQYTALVIVDTGNNGGLDLYKHWTEPHGLPGERKTATFHARTGAGTQATDSTFFRLESASLGPVQHDHRLTSIDDPPDPGMIAGFVGNDVLAHCAAVIFDVRARQLWLEPPCDRPTPEPLHEWRLGKQLSPDFPDRPWVVESIVAAGSTADAGVLVGDRILSVDGIPAELDVEKIQDRFKQRPGTRVTVELVRAGKRQRLVVPLHLLVDDGATPTP